MTLTYIQAFCPLPKLHSLTSWVTFGIGFQIRCTAKYSSKRNEFAYDLWVWENAEIFPWEIFFFSYCDSIAGTISQKAELFLNAMAWKRISLRGAKFSHDCLFVHQCSLAELPISNFTMLQCYYAMIIGACCFRFGLWWTFQFECWLQLQRRRQMSLGFYL